ncbi:MAG: hypothetical protein GY749_12135 [Desulfobacteraceae bacterium]|nr:hypothetical protein [Desulfobacteraceae bacterium]
MSSNELWQEIQNDISSFLENETLADFRPLLEKLYQYSSAQAYPPEIFKTFIEIIRKMSADVRQGRPIYDLLEQTISGTYLQPDWQANNVFQADGDVFCYVLDKFKKDIKPPEIPIPVVLLVMTATEAQELLSGDAFPDNHPELRENFEQLQTLLAEHNETSDWVQRYGEKPELWKPFGGGSDNINKLIYQALERVEKSDDPLSPFTDIPLSPFFIDIHRVNKCDRKSRRELRQLREDGCVVIMDVISMHHPSVQREFRRSLLDAFPSTLVAKIAPVDSVFELKQDEVVIFIEQYIKTEFYRRMTMDPRGQCMEISRPIHIGNWLTSHISKLLPDDINELTDDIRQYWYWYHPGEI